MGLKDLFIKNISPLASPEEAFQDVESPDYAHEISHDKFRIVPKVDFSEPANYARYGLASKYYKDAIESIYRTYPYDGSLAEKQKWLNSASHFQNYYFENEYPRTTGYAIFSPPGNGGEVAPAVFSQPTSPEYILIYGGPNEDANADTLAESFPELDGKANYYNETDRRTINLEMDGTYGNTVEFWLKRHSTTGMAANQRQVIFDLDNGNPDTGSVSYARFSVQIEQDVGAVNLKVAYLSGSWADETTYGGFYGTFEDVSELNTTEWNHYAISLVNERVTVPGVRCTLHVNGELIETVSQVSGSVSAVTGSMLGTVGAMRTAWTDSLGGALGYAKLSGSIDELRYWKTARTSEDIGRNWFTHVGGGSNTDDANIELGLYFKFNEGIFTTTSVVNAYDALVLDYSGRISNGTWIGYVSGSRNAGSAFDDYGIEPIEFKDPIINPYHPDITSALTYADTLENSYDASNNAALWNSIPQWIAESDEEEGAGHFKTLLQIVASYFDNLHLMIENIPTIRNINYADVEEGQRPFPYSRRLLESVGFSMPDMLAAATVLEAVGSRNEQEIFAQKIYDTKNTIYRNLYNNIINIYKTKGNLNSIRNVLRCMGIDERLIRPNYYVDGQKYSIQESKRLDVIAKKYIDLCHTDRFTGVIYQYSDPAALPADESTFLSGSGPSVTFETSLIFPRYFDRTSEFYQYVPFITASIMGVHGADATNPIDYSYTAPDPYIQVSVERPTIDSRDARFVLSYYDIGAATTVRLASDIYQDVYEDGRWTLAVRIKPLGEVGNKVDGSEDQYLIELYGVHAEADVIEHEFTLSASILTAPVSNIASLPLRMYAGAQYNDFTGSLLMQSDVRIGSVSAWYSYLTNGEIQEHAIGVINQGVEKPLENAIFYNVGSDFEIHKADTLALHWTFDNVTGSDAGGEFNVLDCSSGSFDKASAERFGDYAEALGKKHPGRGAGFLPDVEDIYNWEHLSVMTSVEPSQLYGTPKIEIREEDDEWFTKESAPTRRMFSLEKSLYANISDEILKLFASIVDFNNLIGEPVNRYRDRYKSLEKLRQLYFERTTDVRTVEEYLEFYKWLDTAISHAISQLIPATLTTRTPESLDIVESHVLERNKYQSKFPTIEFTKNEPVGYVHGIEESFYNWKGISAPPSGLESEKCEWWDKRANRSEPAISSGDATIDSQRENIRKIAETQVPLQSSQIPDNYDNVTAQSYEGGTYVLRSLARTYRLGVNAASKKEIRSKKAGAVENLVGSDNLTIDVTRDVDPGYCADCLDNRLREKDEHPTDPIGSKFYKREAGFYIHRTEADVLNGPMYAPFKMYSHYDSLNDIAIPEIVGMHRDLIGEEHDAPMQGVFAQTHVGGWQYRHVPMNLGFDDITTRPEGFRINYAFPTYTIYGAYLGVLPHLRYTREEYAKRPMNIKNILSSTSSMVLGNYQHNYEVVQTSSRMKNNIWFVNNSDYPFADQASDLISGSTDFELPERTVCKSVFVERFSSPGGPEVMSRGFLDRESEEYSVYNALPWRNSLVRSFVDLWSSAHTLQFGLSSLSPTMGNWHKVNRNTQWKPVIISGSTIDCSPRYDNFFVQHAIPASDKNYMWITASADSYPCIGYIPKDGLISGSGGYVGAIDFSESGSIFGPGGAVVYAGAYLGYNQALYQEIDEDAHLFGGTSDLDAEQNAAYFSFLNGPYQHPSWKQVRSADHPVARYLRAHNIISVEDEVINKDIDDNKTWDYSWHSYGMIDKSHGSYKDARADTFQDYCEPCIYMGHPLVVLLKNATSKDVIYALVDVETAGKYFANTELNNRLNMPQKALDSYNMLYETYAGNAASQQFAGLIYQHGVYPRSEMMGLARSRARMNYTEVAGSGSNGYDRGVIDRKKIWDTSIYTRCRTYGISTAVDAYNSVYSHDSRNSVWPLDEMEDSYTSGYGDKGNEGELHVHITWAQTSSYAKPGEFNYLGFFDQDSNANPITASMLYIHPVRIASGAIEYGMPAWHTPEESGRAPWFTSYDAFAEDILPHSKNMSLVPEFRISQHMPYYVEDNGGNFRKSNYEYLDLQGGAYSSSGDASSYDREFFNTCAHSSVAENFTKIFKDHEKFETAQQMILKCNAVKKLLPYNGFYPVQRTTQLGNLFYDAYATRIDGSGTERQLQSLLQPFYAPGIMYNTIKSGIAVDWAAHTGSTAAQIGGLLGDPSYAVCANTSTSDYLYAQDFSNGMNYINNGLSVFVWIKTKDENAMIMENSDDRTDAGKIWKIYIEGGYFVVEVYDPTGFKKYVGTWSQVNDNTWHHIGFTYDPATGTLELYHHGRRLTGTRIYKQYDQAMLGLNNPADVDLYVAATYNSGVAPFITPSCNGVIDECCIYTAALAEGVAADIYLQGQINPTPPLADLLCWWTMGDSLGDAAPTEINDVYGAGVNLTGSGAWELVEVYSNGDGGYLATAPNYRIPFEAIISPSSYLSNTKLRAKDNVYLLAPSWILTGSAGSRPYFNWNGESASPLYEMAIHNFLGEAPKFFLKNGLTTLSSKKQADFSVMTAGVTYYMDVVLYKTSDFDLVKSPHDGTSCSPITSSCEDSFLVDDDLSFHGRYFGPAVSYTSSEMCHDLIISGSYSGSAMDAIKQQADPAYAVYTPPYFYGKSVARLSFAPTESKKYSISEILAGMEIEYINEELTEKIACKLGETPTTGSSPLYAGSMKLDASVKIDGIARTKAVTWTNIKGDYLPQDVTDLASEEYNQWVIYPRFECPMFNFADADVEDCTLGPYGMWINYGQPMSGTAGVYLGVEESFKERQTAERSINPNSGSLIHVCGFKPSAYRLGEVSDNKEIEEAIVAIPFVDHPSESQEAPTIHVCEHNFFAIDKEELSNQWAAMKTGKVEKKTSIVKMLEAAPKYYLPPEMDFMTYHDLQPFAMYFFEFKQQLSQEDLGRIWQGVMPDIAVTAEKDETVIAHEFGKDEFFGGKKLPDNIRWMVFKVKKKAEKSYYNLTADTQDDSKFKFKFNIGVKEPEYNYNWPYDYCSLVEYASLDVGFDMNVKSNKNEPLA